MTISETKIKFKEDSSVEFSDKRSHTFTDYLLEQLPDFYAEDIVGTEEFRFLKFLNVSEDTFDTLYTQIKRFYDTLDLDKAHPKYLFKLGTVLGLTEINDLTFSDDLEKITEQRFYIKETIHRLLVKGGIRSLTRLFYGLGITINIENLWTKDWSTFISDPNKYVLNYVLSSDYSGEYDDNIQYHQEYINSDNYDLISEIDSSISWDLNINEISKVEINDYNYIFVNTDDGIFFRDTLENWFSATNSSSGTDFKLYEKQVYIRDNDVLKTYFYDNMKTVSFSVSGCQHIDIIYDSKKDPVLLIDTGTKLQTRNLKTYTLLSEIEKLNSNNASHSIVKENETYAMFNSENDETYLINVSDDKVLTYPTSAVDNYSVSTRGTRTKFKPCHVKDNWIVGYHIATTTSSSGALTQVNFQYTGDILSAFGIEIPSSMIIKDVFQIDSEVFFYLGTTGIGVRYLQSNLTDSEIIFNDIDTYTYNNFIETNYIGMGKSGGGYKFQDSPSKVFMIKSSGSSLKIDKFYGLLKYDLKYFKTHYFNLIIDSDSGDIFTPRKHQELIELVKTIQPAHTELLELKHNMGTVIDEVSGVGDALTSPLSGTFPLDADGAIEFSLATPTSTMNFAASGGQIADGVLTVEIS